MNRQLIALGLKLDLIKKEEIISFAETEILKEKYDDIFLEIASLSESSDKNKLFEILFDEQNISDSEFHKLYPVLIHYIIKSVNKWEELQLKLIRFNNEYPTYLNNMDYEFWSRLKDDYFLRKSGFSGCMKMPKELNIFIYNNSLKLDQDRLLKYIINKSLF